MIRQIFDSMTKCVKYYYEYVEYMQILGRRLNLVSFQADVGGGRLLGDHAVDAGQQGHHGDGSGTEGGRQLLPAQLVKQAQDAHPHVKVDG